MMYFGNSESIKAQKNCVKSQKEDIMISKIIALAIAFLLLISAPIYNAIANQPGPVSFGAGDGESKVIVTAEDLNTLLTNIPAVSEYLESDAVLEADETFTMTENGTNSVTSGKFEWKVLEEGEERVRVYTETTQTMSHVLEMYFATNCVYYHCIGESAEATDSYGTDGEDNTNIRYDDYCGGERTTRSFDIEIFYSKDKTLIKYNDFNIITEERDNDSPNAYEKVDGVEIQEGTNITLEDIVKAVSKTFGKWMSPDAVDGGFDEENFPAEPTDPNDEDAINAYLDAMLDMMAIEFVNMFCQLWNTEIENSTQMNTQYLTGLAGFLVANQDTHFNKVGDYYELDSDKTEKKLAYFGSIGVSSYAFDLQSSDVSVGFELNTDEVSIDQEIKLYSKNQSGQRISITTNTILKNVGNTVVSVEDITVQTVYDAYKDPIKDLFRPMMEQMKEGN